MQRQNDEISFSETFWRTRRAPYELVWDKVERELERNPNLCVKDYFQTLQRDYPGQFNQGQLRTPATSSEGMESEEGHSL